ncbi:MAG: helix-hairpin-helix domain-containing protein, partial [Desulfobulbaceae bacterium]|nr:helix-hairpin-helix domain-containing protein [Desulfobulbaceae bacterium]
MKTSGMWRRNTGYAIMFGNVGMLPKDAKKGKSWVTVRSMENENDDLKSWMILSALPGLGPALIHRLVEHLGSPARVLAAGAKGVKAIKGIGPALASRFADRNLLEKAA